MFTKTLTTAIVTGILLTGAMQSQSFANNGGGGGGEAPVNYGSATAHNSDGSSVTSRGNRDGLRTITKRDRRGKVISTKRVGGKKAPKRVAKRKSRPWASSYDPATRTRITSMGNGDRTRTVITISPFGLSIGFSR